MVTDKASTARWMGLALGAVLAACGTGGGQDSAPSLDRDRGRGGGSGNGGGNGGGGSDEGAALYADSCAGCHGPLASSEVAGASSASITAAINGNVGGMGSLSLTAAQVDAISLALGGTGGGGGGSGDGATLYAASCAGCHGPLASSEVRGESASSIREAIADDEGGMSSLTLTDAQLGAIAAALGGSGGVGGDDDLRSGVPSLSRRAAHPVTLRTALALR